ncbi:MAG: alkaline phosphatase family protein [Clostridia bacterium]|nr:alkaline phosphatase family protein [Clostridia bacterium]
MERKIYKYCAVLGVDGMGNFNKQANTPVLDALFENGASTYDALSMNPTISAENWGAMLLGLTPLVHGLTNGYISSHEYTNKEFPSVFTRIRRAFPDAYLASVCNWDPINHGIVEHDVDVDMATADNDDELNPIIIEKVKNKPKFLFVQYDDVDGAGHHAGYGNPEHIERIEKTDALIGEVLGAYREAGIFDETLFIVIADHGGIRHGHGGYTDEEKYVFLGVSGVGIEKSNVVFARTVDVAATVLYALGIDFPEYNRDGFSSQVPEGVFPWYGKAYVKTTPKVSTHETKTAPAFDAPGGLADIFGRDRFKLALFFENEIKDESGNCSFTEHGNIKYYSNGVCSFCGEFGVTGAAQTGDLSFGDGSFTLAVWLLTEKSVLEECVVCSNKDWWWQKRRETGFSFVMKNSDTVVLFGNGNDDFSVVTPFPDEHESGWLHAAVCVDRNKREIRVYYGFELIRAFPIPEEFMCGADAPVFVVGNDVGYENNEKHFPNLFRMDDLLILDGALDDKDIAKLEKYYS